MSRPAAFSAGVRVATTGGWNELGGILSALAEDEGLQIVRGLDAGPEVVVHASAGVDVLAAEIEGIRQQSTTQMVIVATDRSPAMLERAFANGCVDVVIVDAGAPAAAAENIAFAIRKAVVAARQTESGRGSVFTVFSPKGGTGKTVTSTNIAAALARRAEKRVLLIDLDLQFGDVAMMLGLEPKWTLRDALSAPGELDEQKLAGFVLRHPSGIDVLAAPERPEESELLTDDKVSRLLEVAVGSYDALVVDTSPYFHGPMLSALDFTDTLLLLSGPDMPTLKNLRLVRETLDQLSFPRDRIRVVLNRAGEREGIGAAELAAADMPVSFELPLDPAVPAGVNRGVPAVLRDEGSPFATAVTAMALELSGLTPSPARPARMRKAFGRRTTRIVQQRRKAFV
jgi:pilus assembly protein CpaE